LGDFNQENISESHTQGRQRNSKLIASIMLLFGLFAPLMITVSTYGGRSTVVIQSMFWMYNQASYMYNYNGFSLIPPEALFSMFPLILLRMAPVFQIFRYYNGKTTRKRALIASTVGDGPFLIMGIPYLFLSMIMISMFMIPLPFQFIFGILVLWRYPIPDPTTPWEGDLEPKSWWEKEPDSQQEKKEAEDELW